MNHRLQIQIDMVMLMLLTGLRRHLGTIECRQNCTDLQTMSSRPPIKLSAEEMKVEPVAYKPLIVFTLAYGAWLGAAALSLQRSMSPFVLTPVLAMCVFVLFTPMHDAAHRAVAKQHKWLNELVGRLCAYTFAAPFDTFRFVHLDHHKYTNDPVKDPDYWSGR